MKRLLPWFVGLALLAFLAGVALVIKPFDSVSPEPVVQTAAVVPEQVQREVVLYFADPVEPFLVQEVRHIAECDSDLSCVEAIVRELVRGPQQDLVAVIPSQALLLGVQLVEDTVWLDFNQALIDRHPAGSSSELATVHALVNTLAANFPYVRKLVLQVNGVKLETLRGHVDLRRPVAADFSRVRQELEVPVVDEPLTQASSDETGEASHE